MKFDRIFSVIVPKYSNSGERISTEKISEYAKKMAGEFGGVTVHPTVLGCWVTKDGKLVCEENVLMEAALDASEMPDYEVEKKREFVKKLAKDIGKELGQEAVMAWEDVIDRLFIEGEYRPSVPEKFKEHDYFKKLID